MAQTECKSGHIHGGALSAQACDYASENPGEVTWSSRPGVQAPESDAATGGRTRPSATFTQVSGHGTTRGRPAPASEATQAQRDAITRLGGTTPEGASRLDASAIIDRLSAAKAERDARREAAFERMRERQTIHKTNLGIPAEMLFDIREGRFAVSLAGTTRLDFVRVSHIKPRRNGSQRDVGSMRVQTQHGDMLKDRFIIARNGDVRVMSNSMTLDKMTEVFMAIVVDQRAAAIRYGREKGHCCRCGKQLTDERSRYYGIGPECEKHWPEIIAEVDEAEGEFVSDQPYEE